MEIIRGRGWMGWPVLLTLVVGALLVADISSLAARRRPAVSQPIAFSHRKHTADLQLGCDFCHRYFRVGRHSGLPGAETCGICHMAPLGESPEAARLMESLQGGEEVRFNKLFRLPDHVFYSHRRHVESGNLECALCHGGIADTEVPPERPLVAVDMAFCLDCHLARGVTTDCTACHR